MGWTHEQQQAIDARGASLLISAAAGSGKTSVLVERLINQLCDIKNKIPADKMVVVTFTKDAATEMKQRLSSALSRKLEKEPNNHWLNHQQLLLQSAKISTIHSFCFDLIRDNIQELELSSGFRIMDETEAELMISRTISDIVSMYYEKFPEKIEKLYDRFCYKDDSKIEILIADIYKFISSVPYGIRWLEKCREKYENKDEFLNFLCSEYEKQIISMLSKAESLSAQCVEIAGEGVGDKAIDILDTEYFTICNFVKVFSDKNTSFEEKVSAYNSPEFKRLTLSKNVDEETKEKIKKFRDEYKKILKDLIPDCAELIGRCDEDFQVHSEVLGVLCEMISLLEDELWKNKVEKNCIGFSDAETITVKLLSFTDENDNIIKSPLAKELSDYYKIIMIDEFQDTNNNQDLIFKLLSHGGTAQNAGDNMFMVGDVKQSIYRFRLANPGNFINTMKNSVKYSEETSGENSFIQLNKNFRSSRDVIEFVNFIFRGIMSEEVGEICYDSGEELVMGASFSERQRKTEVALLVQDDNEDFDTSAGYTARKIADMLKNKVQVDNKDGVSTRDCRKRDFCILLRRKTDASRYVSELSKYGISAYCEETSGYLRSREISVIINILRITNNPLIDTSFASVMLSPMFMITDDELAQLRLAGGKGHIYEALCRIIETPENYEVSEEFVLKLRMINDTLKELRLYSATMSLTELVKRIYDRTDFISVIRSYDDADRKRANLRALLEYVKIYQESSDDGLDGFLRYIDRIVKINGDFRQGQTVSTSEDVVMIKTIHKSKGLEFPFVFLCETHIPFNTLDLKKNIQINYDYGIGFRLQKRREFIRYTTLPFEVMARKNHGDSISEEMRLLYVALTRAKEQLFIPMKIAGTQRKKLLEFAKEIHSYDGITPEIAKNVNCMSDWLLMSLITHHNSRRLRELSGYDMFYTQKSDFDIDFKEVDIRELCEDIEKEEAVSGEIQEQKASPQSVETLIKSFSFDYDKRLCETQAKVSVSDLAKDKERFGVTLKRPSFIQNKGRLTGAEKGTIVHSILQHSDFVKLSEDMESEIRRLVELGFITENQLSLIDTQMVKKFVDSEIFKRALCSDKVEKERKFLMKISDLGLDGDRFKLFDGTGSMIQGIIDMYFEEEDGLVLVDYKTDAVNDVSLLVRNYSEQLRLYKAALEKIERRNVKQTIIYSLRLGKWVELV